MSELGLKGLASDIDPVDVDTVGGLLGEDLVGVVGFVYTCDK